ncbi:MAG: FAD binding domain-containing protein [Bryobacteraceae bacterium]
MKNTIALTAGSQAFISQHIGDLETDQAYEAFRRVIGDFEKLYETQPVLLAADAHPDYLSTKFAIEQLARAGPASGLRLIRVQHHVAHVLSCMAENEVPAPVLGVSWDGTGYGLDGTVWGGEFLTVTEAAWERVAHLRRFPLPGGDRAVRERLPILALVLGKLGSAQIRNRGTLGGNLVNASPAADSVIALLLLDAEVVLASRQGERSLPVEGFLLGPGKTALARGEFVRSVRIPIPEGALAPYFHKIGRRKALTISIASLGALLRVEKGRVKEARLAVGSVAPTPLRLRRVEDLVRGRRLTPQLIAEARALAAQSVSPIDDVRASGAYRRDVTADLVARLLEDSLHV